MTSTTRIALACVLALALGLRLIGISFGLPAVYNPDEIAITARTLAFAKGDLNPHNFLYPTFYFYALFAWLGLTFVVLKLTGIVASLHAFQTQFFVDPTDIYLSGRLLGALCGTATVGLTYVLGARLSTERAGLLAALFLAVAPGHVRDSHYVKHDVPVTLAIVVAQLAILRLLKPPPTPTLPPQPGGGSEKGDGTSPFDPARKSFSSASEPFSSARKPEPASESEAAPGSDGVAASAPSVGAGAASGAPSVGVSAASVGASGPSLGANAASVSVGAASVGASAPSVGVSGPSVGADDASVSAGAPSVGASAPSVGVSAASLGVSGPSVGADAASVSTGALSVGASGPSLGASAPSVGVSAAGVGASGPSVGVSAASCPSVGANATSLGVSGPSVGVSAASLGVSAAGVGGNAGGFVLAGVACGVACSIHYYAVFLAVPLLLAIGMATRGRGWRVRLTRIGQAGGAAMVVFFALSPFLLVEPGTAWRDILANRQIVVDRAVEGQHRLFGNLGAYLAMLWSDGAGWPVCAGAAIGAMLLLRRRWRLALIILAFPVAFLLFISNTVAASRYLNPVFPTCAILAAIAVVESIPGGAVRVALATERRQESMSGLPPARRRVVASGRGTIFPVLIALLMSLPGLVEALRLDFFFRQPDTRSLALTAIERTVPSGSTILVQPYSVPLAQSRDSLIEALRAHQVDPAQASAKFALRLALDPYPSPAYRTLFLGEGGLDQDKIYLGFSDAAGDGLRRAGVQYVVLKRYNAPDPAVEPLRARLVREGRLLTTISPYHAGADAATRARVAPFLHNTDTPYDPALERPGPGIEVWQVPPS